MTPEARADRWFRRYEPDYPVALWDGTLRRAGLVWAAATRDLRREFIRAVGPLMFPILTWVGKRLP